MHVLPELDLMEGVLADHLPHLRPAQRRGLALWVCGAILAHSACQSAVLAALLLPARGGYHALRQRLREWLYDGADRAAPCATEIAIEHCSAGCWLGAAVANWPWLSTRRRAANS